MYYTYLKYLYICKSIDLWCSVFTDDLSQVGRCLLRGLYGCLAEGSRDADIDEIVPNYRDWSFR